MIRCDRCGNYITMEEPIHLMVKEMEEPQQAKIWCEECYEGIK